MIPNAVDSYCHHFYHKFNDVSVFSPRICMLFGDVYYSHFGKKSVTVSLAFRLRASITRIHLEVVGKLKYLNWLYNTDSLNISNSTWHISAVYSVLISIACWWTAPYFFILSKSSWAVFSIMTRGRIMNVYSSHSARPVNIGKHVWKYQM